MITAINDEAGMKRKFSMKELDAIATLDPKLQIIITEVNKIIPIYIVEGHRGEEAQNAAVAKGTSKIKWPDGKHNKMPSQAVDIAPIFDGKIDWTGKFAAQKFYYMNGVVLAVAAMLGIPLRQGCDFNMNLNVEDDGFKDLPHQELRLA